MSDAAAVELRKEPRYERSANDWYVEPAWAVELLLANERIVGSVYDPACGGGNIPRVFEAAGYEGAGGDIVERGYSLPTADFLLDPIYSRPDWRVDNIVCNPPFDQAVPFIEKALTVARFKVCMLLRLAFLESRRRADWFKRQPLARVHVFADRVSMPPGGSAMKAEGGKVAFAWFVFAHDHQGPPTLNWLVKP